MPASDTESERPLHARYGGRPTGTASTMHGRQYGADMGHGAETWRLTYRSRHFLTIGSRLVQPVQAGVARL